MRTRGARAALALVAVAAATALAGCGGGPSEEQVAQFDAFAHGRQQQYGDFTGQRPESIKEYVLGDPDSSGSHKYEGPDAIFAGHFTDASSTLTEDGDFSIVGTFHIDTPVYGNGAGSDIDVLVGPEVDAVDDWGDALVGAGNCVVFLRKTDDGWYLADYGWAIALSDKEGKLSMPLVPADLESQYLAGVIDVADIEALLIAGDLDKGDVLSGTQSDAIQDALDTADQN